MDPIMILILLLLAALVGAVAWLGMRLSKTGNTAPVDPQAMLLLQNQMAQMSKALDERMFETNRSVMSQSKASNDIMRDVTEKLTKMEDTTKQVLDVTAQLQNLKDMLKNPKQRGILGEYYLETLLKNVLPPGGFEMQYKFKDGEIVDAVVFVKDRIVPIDSKFSLENYNRIVEETNQAERDKLEKTFINDLKLRIIETSKYIRPNEGTMDFAFMFIPHEAIYYDLLINRIGAVADETESLIQRAAGKHHVVIVSPTSFLAYLQTVLQGLRALQIEDQAKEIRLRVTDLGRHLAAYDQYFKGIGKNLDTTVNQYNLASKELGKIDKDVLRVSGETMGIEPLLIGKTERGAE